MNQQAKAIVASYTRSFIAAGLAVYMAGVTDPKAILSACVAALLPVLMRWLNPNDKVYGRK